MKLMRGWFTVALMCAGLAGMGRAEELAIQSFNGTGRLVFNELSSATNYRVEWACSPTGTWTNFASAMAAMDNIPASGFGSVTCSVPVFYRVVASVTNAWLVIETTGELTFGTVRMGGTATRTLTLRNRGGAALTVTGISYPDGFSGDWSGVIPAGYEQNVTVTFTPVTDADYSGTVTVQSDSASGNSTLAVSGRGSSDYLVIDVAAGPSALSYPVSYLAEVPDGGWSDQYRTTKIVLRRIAASDGAFTMGSPIDELGRNTDETQHQVTLSQDFYICVFEVTQKQWERVTGAWPSWFTNATYRDSRPVEQVSYNDIRGSSFGTDWPASDSVDATSFMGKLRIKTGKAFDLPTESQREYACRAGTTTALNSGYNLTSTDSDAHMSEVGRYFPNGWNGNTRGADTNSGTAKVGSYLPNAWGLYDMHGNVWEWCLDWYPGYEGSYRVLRGGGWSSSASQCRSACRSCNTPNATYDFLGFRVALPLGQP